MQYYSDSIQCISFYYNYKYQLIVVSITLTKTLRFPPCNLAPITSLFVWSLCKHVETILKPHWSVSLVTQTFQLSLWLQWITIWTSLTSIKWSRDPRRRGPMSSIEFTLDLNLHSTYTCSVTTLCMVNPHQHALVLSFLSLTSFSLWLALNKHT